MPADPTYKTKDSCFAGLLAQKKQSCQFEPPSSHRPNHSPSRQICLFIVCTLPAGKEMVVTNGPCQAQY